MFKIFAFVVFAFLNPIGFAQTETHKKATDSFIDRFNSNDFEGIYQSYSAKFKSFRTKKQTVDFLTRIKTDSGLLRSLRQKGNQPLSRNLERVYYDADFEYRIMTVRITTNAQGEITGLLIKRNIYL